ncbi:hypothetical protein [Streptomyces sp. NPDC047046]|uniref:hypothetical protein n=1 Tax=Streptomyces sp. NPDC047046 TaxID=3155378 RepID=UPI0033DC8AA3
MSNIQGQGPTKAGRDWAHPPGRPNQKGLLMAQTRAHESHEHAHLGLVQEAAREKRMRGPQSIEEPFALPSSGIPQMCVFQRVDGLGIGGDVLTAQGHDKRPGFRAHALAFPRGAQPFVPGGELGQCLVGRAPSTQRGDRDREVLPRHRGGEQQAHAMPHQKIVDALASSGEGADVLQLDAALVQFAQLYLDVTVGKRRPSLLPA